jgi:hypothetical protein
LKRLRTIAHTLIRELRRRLPAELVSQYQADFELYERVLNQQPKDKNKIYSLHEPQVCYIAKGKDHKAYEYGAKASVVSTAKDGIILAAVHHEKPVHDNHSLPEVIERAMWVRDKPIKAAICDRGYRGKRQFGDTTPTTTPCLHFTSVGLGRRACALRSSNKTTANCLRIALHPETRRCLTLHQAAPASTRIDEVASVCRPSFFGPVSIDFQANVALLQTA